MNAPSGGAQPLPSDGPVTAVVSTARSGFDGMAFNLNIVRPERGPATTDARHRAMGFASLGLGHGVTVGVSFTARSVLPFDIVTGRDDNQDSLVTDARPPLPRRAELGIRLSF